MASSRITNTRRNIVASYASMILTYVFQFVSRTVIVRVLGSEYLGLSSLVQSILSVLSVAELGFSSSIVYNMYKPIAQGNESAVCAILAFYRKVYHVVGMVIVSGGLILMPFLPSLIHGTVPEDVNLYYVYILYLANSGVSYFMYAYYGALITAHQRMDLTKTVYMLVGLLQYSLQLVSLLLFRNFYAFVSCIVVGTVAQNLLTARIARGYFPQYVCRGEIDDEIKADIISRVKGLMVGRVSALTYTTFDSVILSALIGLNAVAMYNNYLTVYNAVGGIFSTIRMAMEASVGDSVASETVEKNHADLGTWQLLFSGMAMWGASCMMCLYQPFMTLWMGPDMLLPMRDVVLLCALFSEGIVQHSYFLYMSGNGLWWEMRWPYIVSAVANLVLNYVLGMTLGITGVILSTLLVGFASGFIWQASIVFKLYFRQSPARFYHRQVVYFVVEMLGVAIAYLLCSLVPIGGIMGLALRFLIAVTVPVPIFLLAYAHTPEFAHAKNIIAVAAGKRIGKRAAADK